MSGVTIVTAFICVLLVGAVLGIVGAKFFLPRFGDAVGAFLFSMGGRSSKQDASANDSPKAVRMVAAGNYRGAVDEYQRMLRQKPDDLHTIGEIAKIHAECLEDPETALSFLREQLASRPWPVDGEAFILLRMAGIHREVQHDMPRATEVMEQVMARFPKTRHSANARQKLREWTEEDNRKEAAERRKAVRQSVR